MLDKLKIPITADRETLVQIARTSLRTKLTSENADILTDVRNSFSSIHFSLSLFHK